VSGVSATIYGGAGGNGSGNGGGAAALIVVQRRRTGKSVGRNFENLLESLSSGNVRKNRFGFSLSSPPFSFASTSVYISDIYVYIYIYTIRTIRWCFMYKYCFVRYFGFRTKFEIFCFFFFNFALSVC